MPRRAASRRKSSRKMVKFSKSRVRGKGDYTLPEKSKEAGPVEKLGNYLGEKAGGWLGGKAGKMLGSVLGTGDYVLPDGRTVLAPKRPNIKAVSEGIRIAHSEYVSDIITSAVAGDFRLDHWAINAGNPSLFPWLSTMCKSSFQQYKFDQLIFEFTSYSGNALNSVNTALGAVFSAVNYDFSDPIANSRYEIENTAFSSSSKPADSFFIPVELNPKQTGLNGGLLYITNGNNVPAGADPKTYNLGRLQIGTVGMQGTSVNIGSLRVHYVCRLIKPFLTRPLSNANSFMQQRTGCLVAGNLHLGTAEVANASNHDTLGCLVAGNVFTIDNKRLIVGQRYVFSMVFRGGAAAVVPATIDLSAGLAGFLYFNNFTGAVDSAPQSGLGGSTIMYHAVAFVVEENNSPQTVTLRAATGTLPAAACTVDLHLYQVCGIPATQIGVYEEETDD